jgi:hypothetical protein
MTVNGNRGMTPDLSVIDEAAFIDVEMMQMTIIPFLNKRYAAMFAISTPDDDGNYFSRMLTLNRGGNRKSQKVKVVWPVAEPCDTHKRLGLAHECDCNDNLPHFHSQEARELQRMLLPPQVFNKENNAMINERGMHIYAPEALARVFSTDSNASGPGEVIPRVQMQRGGVIYVAIDPGAGSLTHACLAMVAITLDEAQRPVVRLRVFCGRLRLILSCMRLIYNAICQTLGCISPRIDPSVQSLGQSSVVSLAVMQRRSCGTIVWIVLLYRTYTDPSSLQ